MQHGSPQLHLEAVSDLVEKIEAGDDLKPFLSDKIDGFGYRRPKPRQSKKPSGIEWEPVKDYALNAYDCRRISRKSTVHGYLDLWNWDGTLERIHHAL